MAAAITARPSELCWVSRVAALAFAAVVAVALTAGGGVRPALAQFDNRPQPWVGVPTGKPPPTASSRMSAGEKDPNAQMLVRADEMQYDNTNDRIIAVGNVQIYYEGSQLQADKVVYDKKTKRLRAEGNVLLTEADGKVVRGQTLDLNEQFRDGFVDSLQLEGADKTRFAAPRADRSDKRYTVFQNGVYTACEPCKDDPSKPPRWQVKATRIIHDETEKMIYFEQARLEAFGFPLFYWPYLSTPDPTVKRKTGVVDPRVSYSSAYGAAVTVPYFWALAPDYDFTLTPTATTRQGLLLQGEWRERLMNGSYMIRAAGIFQADQKYFADTVGVGSPGDRFFRGNIDTTGQFSLSSNWVWGWDGSLLTDKLFLQDYGLRTYFVTADPLKSGGLETVSQLYLTGRGASSYFDIRGMYFYGLSVSDVQKQLPLVLPVIDYKNVKSSVLGGEVTYKFNLTSLSRDQADFDPITQAALNSGQCDTISPDPSIKTPASCILRGFPGTYTRASAEATWRRTFIDPYGEKWTPFVSMRADVAALSIDPQPGVSNFLTPGDSTIARVMPAVGLEYRYPFIDAQSWGTQTIEPIAQLIVRPDETSIGRLPNEDAQSLIFDDSNLFSVNKFSGWDRVEGGTRANVGVQYTAQFNKAGFVNVLFGQSYQLFGQNSFAVADNVNTGLTSGLETPVSDYVARIAYQPDNIYTFISRFLFDHETFEARRIELEGRANFDRITLTALYGNYAAQPEIGFLERRQGIVGTVNLKLTQNWSLVGGARYDLEAHQINQHRIGIGYIDDCFAISVNYSTDYNYSGTTTTDQKVMVVINLRTLGGTSFSQSLNQNNSNTNGTGQGLGL